MKKGFFFPGRIDNETRFDYFYSQQTRFRLFGPTTRASLEKEGYYETYCDDLGGYGGDGGGFDGDGAMPVAVPEKDGLQM